MSKKSIDIKFKPEIKVRVPHMPTQVHVSKIHKSPKYNPLLIGDDDDPNDPDNIALYELRRTFKKRKESKKY